MLPLALITQITIAQSALWIENLTLTMKRRLEVKVGLLQLDGKMPNLALMKLSAWHKHQGDDVTVLDLSGFQFDRTYASKVFVGGSGYDLKAELPSEIEAVVPDYESFNTDYSIGFTSRGCIRDCGFCIVREKEGFIRETSMDWIRHSKVIILDNNFLASPRCREKFEYFIQNDLKVCFNQGLDIRLIDSENARLLARVKYFDLKFRRRRLYFAFDLPEIEHEVRSGIATLIANGVKPFHLMFYVLVGYNTTPKQDLHRVELLIKYGTLPYVMRYNSRRDDRQLNAFARWVNGRYYKVCRWEDYTRRSRAT